MSNKSIIDIAIEQIYQKMADSRETRERGGEYRIGLYVAGNIIENLREMHKEEIKDAYNQGYRDVERDVSNIPLIIGDISEYNNAENYYNETYGGNK
jgi:hypothetical protein